MTHSGEHACFIKKEEYNMQDLFSLEGRKAVVIGGGGGIGEAIAGGYLESGAEVVIASRNLASLTQSADLLEQQTGKRPHVLQVDCSDESSVEALVSQAVELMGTVDILVASKGYNKKFDALDFPMDEWDKTFAVNVRGVMLCCKHFGRIMKEKRYGKIVIISSIAGRRSARYGVGNSAYGVSKGAVNTLTEALAAELAEFNITVNAIGPCLTVTRMTEDLINASPEKFRGYISKIPLGRVGHSRDDVGPAIFFASAASDFVTGCICYTDGGLTIAL